MTAVPMLGADGPAPVIFGGRNRGRKAIDDQAGAAAAAGMRDRCLVPVLGLCLLVATTAYLMVFTLLGQIGDSLHASAVTLSWITIAAVITGTVSSALLPALGSVLGQRRLMVGSLGCLGGLAPQRDRAGRRGPDHRPGHRLARPRRRRAEHRDRPRAPQRPRPRAGARRDRRVRGRRRGHRLRPRRRGRGGGQVGTGAPSSWRWPRSAWPPRSSPP